MSKIDEVREFLNRHLAGVLENDLNSYHETTSEDLTLYEWWVTPQRIAGLPFHDFMMESNAQRGTVFGSEGGEGGGKPKVRFDLANLEIQLYGNTAIASYTLLISTALPAGVKVASHNESRVMIQRKGQWQVVHVHKSPAWAAPHMAP